MSDKPLARRRFGQWLTWLFAGVGFIGMIAIIFLVIFVYDLDRPHQPAKVVDEKQRTTLTIDEPSAVPGTNLLEMDVSASEGDYGSLSGRNGDVRNILLVDRATGASRRLLPDNLHHIAQSGFYPAEAQLHERSEGAVAAVDGGDAGKAPAAYYLLAIRRDDDPQRQDVLIGILATGRQGVVMQGIDGIDQRWMMSQPKWA